MFLVASELEDDRPAPDGDAVWNRQLAGKAPAGVGSKGAEFDARIGRLRADRTEVDLNLALGQRASLLGEQTAFEAE